VITDLYLRTGFDVIMQNVLQRESLIQIQVFVGFSTFFYKHQWPSDGTGGARQTDQRNAGFS
jgi:hypothetical protein